MTGYNLPFKPNSVIAELGGGNSPSFHPNIDVRKLPEVDIVADFNALPLPIQSESYDGIFSKYNIEHVSWRIIRPLLKEIYRILKHKGIAVFIVPNTLEQCKAIVKLNRIDESLVCALFGGQRFNEKLEFDEQWDSNAHHCGFSPDYITGLLTEIGFGDIKIIPIQTDIGPTDMIVEATKPLPIQDAIITEEYPNVLKLNIGSFTVMNRDNWVNIDILDLNQYAHEKNYIFKQHDCAKDVPYDSNSVDVIVASHFIEHLNRPDGKQFLKDSFRTLKPAGIIRLTVPDTKIIVQDYLNNTIKRHSSHNEGVKNSSDNAQSLYELLISGHQTTYDENSLTELLAETGFVEIQKMEYQQSKSPAIEKENKDMYPELSLYIEAVKPTGQIVTKQQSIENKQKQYKFSIVYPTYRPGSMELLFTSLNNQTYKNFELILVDDYRLRTDNKQSLYDKIGGKPGYLKYHDVPKKDGFNKFYRFGTTVNTGIIEAFKSDSDIIIFLQDCTYLEPDQLEKWNNAFNKSGLNTIITATATIISSPLPEKWKDPFSIWNDSIAEQLLKMSSKKDFDKIGFKYHSRWIPTEYEGFYTGIPKSIMIKLNGLDENIDYPCEQANDFFERAKHAGFNLEVNNELNCYMIDHHIWHPPDEKDDYLWHISRLESLRREPPPPVISLQQYIQQLKNGNREIKANNCFDLSCICNITNVEVNVEVINVENAYAKRIKFIIDNAIKHKDGKILNIGCGDCYPFVDYNLDIRHLNILHIDTTDQIPESIKPRVNFRLLDAQSLPFKDKEFSCSILGDTLEHVEDPVKALQEAKRVSKNVYITVPNEYDWDKSLNPFTNPGHIRYYTYEELKRDLDKGLGSGSYTITQYNGGGWSFWIASTDDTPTKDKLRIALISTPFFTVPPQGYSGLEQIVGDLAETLDELGHKVTIFAPEGSKAPLHGHVVYTGKSINTVNVNWFEEEKKNYEVYKNIITPDKFDIVHDHTWMGFPYLLNHPNIVHTHHGGYSWQSPPPKEKPNLVAISNYMKSYTEQYFQAKSFSIQSEYVHNGIDLNKYPYQEKKSTNLLFVGRFSSIKQPHIAIEVARKTNHEIDLVGGTFTDNADYIKQLEQMCDNKTIRMYKDVSHEFKINKMKNAKALIFPSKFNEPFGLVSLEAMACGTPVIAFDDGAIKEVVIHGKTGFICKDIEEMTKALNNIHQINPEDCRKRAEELSRHVMANNYVRLYNRILKGDGW